MRHLDRMHMPPERISRSAQNERLVLPMLMRGAEIAGSVHGDELGFAKQRRAEAVQKLFEVAEQF
jgi:hypothetical protein